jgi:hypothetical protein
VKTLLASPTYRQADQDFDFLQHPETRGVRLQIDYLKAERGLRERGVEDTIVVFGSTRIREPAAAARLVETLRAQLDSAEIPDMERVSEEDIERASCAYTDAQTKLRENHEAWAMFRKANEAREIADQEAAKARANAQQADLYRDAAKGVDEIVSRSIAAVAPRGMGVKDGRLVVETDRGMELFSDLSAGERWRLALDVAIDAVGEDGVVPIAQEAWEGLDPQNRIAIAQHARERQVWICTAEADEGDLRAEVFSA